MKQSLSLATAVLSLATSVNATQIITPTAASTEVSAGSNVVFAPRYSVTAPDNGAETGLGLRVHFNANAVDFKGVTSPFAYGLQPIGEVTADTDDFDADPTTDRYVILAWVDLTAQWPGADELPLALGNVLFQVKSGFSGTTHIRTSASDTANGTALQSTPMTLTSVAAAPPAVLLRGLLQGAYNNSTGLMRDGLRASALISSAQPYASLGYSGGETTMLPLLNTTGADAPVDWVLVELRDKTTPQTRLASKAALVQADGDVMDAATGSTTLSFASVSAGAYYLALRHRNHLGVMSAAPLNLSATPTVVDFSQASTAVYGADVRITQGMVLLLPTGDVNHDNKLIADGPDNDRNTVLGTVLSNASNPGAHTNFQLHGYYPSDLNLDGKTLYVGPDNDVNTLLANILLSPQNSTSSTNYILPGSLPQ
ncbi:hypothetical protein [Thiothrix fructosivorans]|jgi:hypothetical protein|uniref:Uncharacterized protein n=1 Tax=Thiothrix fructosivorans TaxID=111770 RepID=A0A8B0SM00_9GAMM|nr:hypothetical protein [Thiothrix fructosivorans]MBO0612539.1 hypothetical protein [Thiothrix fructosivorans]QTX11984.1 hypothetical protein J1836_006540 [Thiothrix fructosivorans]